MLDRVALREAMALGRGALDVGERCDARFGGFARYFRAVVIAVDRDDATYDVRYDHGALERGVCCEHVRRPRAEAAGDGGGGGALVVHGPASASAAAPWAFAAAAPRPISARLLAANPAMEEKDESVQWCVRYARVCPSPVARRAAFRCIQTGRSFRVAREEKGDEESSLLDR